MKKQRIFPAAILAGSIIFIQSAVADTAELSTPPASEAEKEAAYTTAIENRTTDILKFVELTDAAKSNTVHDVIVAQYRALRARDLVIDAKLKADGKDPNYANRASQLAAESKHLHDQFLAKLGEALSAEQVEKVKDAMTYKKVKVTFDAYCAIVSGLTDADKAKVLELLKQAREEAMDGGNAPEKSEIFTKYKHEINDYLNAHGHDTAKAFKDWEARQAGADTKPAEPAK